MQALRPFLMSHSMTMLVINRPAGRPFLEKFHAHCNVERS